MSAVAILPARGGSRRIPRKNIALFHGRPMISYPIAAAKESGLFDSIMVTTDDFLIGAIAGQCGAEYVSRPERLAQDETGTQEVARWLLSEMCAPNHYEYACVIYPCTPMMTEAQLRFGFSLIADPPMIAPPETYSYVPGWFYWGKANLFIDGVPLPPAGGIKIPENWIDINTPEDFSKAELMYAAWRRKVEGDTDGVAA